MNITTQNSFVSIVTLLFIYLATGFAFSAGLPTESCNDNKNRPISTKNIPDLNSFAKVKITKSGSVERYTILINPAIYYLSRETKSWLYLRQCAHINLQHQTMRRKKNNKNEKPNLREEKDADCWAINYMLNNKKYNFSKRKIIKISNDIKMLSANLQRWQEVFGTPRRNVYTHDCAQR